VRLAYRHEGLAEFQLPNGSLRPAFQLAARTFVVFAEPNPGARPAGGDYRLAHPYGIAEVDSTSRLVFAGGAYTPVLRHGVPVAISLSELRAAAR